MRSLKRKRWRVRVTTEVRDWLRDLSKADPETFLNVNAAIDELAATGPALGRPLVDTLRAEQRFVEWLASERERREKGDGRD